MSSALLPATLTLNVDLNVGPGEVKCLHLRIDAWRAQAKLTPAPLPQGHLPWVPLILAPEWADAHPEHAWGTGPELVTRFFAELTGKTLASPTPGEMSTE